MKKILAAVVAALAVSGCVTLAPGAEKVIFTRNPEDVAGCKVLDLGKKEVFGNEKPLKNRILAAGGDTFFVTQNNAGAYRGVAYNCKGVEPRMPATVIVKPQ